MNHGLHGFHGWEILDIRVHPCNPGFIQQPPRPRVPAGVAAIRREICTAAGCPHQLNYDDPCEACPEGHFGRHESTHCGDTKAPAPRPPQTARPAAPAQDRRDRSKWPFLARVVSSWAEEEDTGVGDIIARKLGAGGGAFKRFYKALTGHECGCGNRQARLNEIFPL